MNQPRPLRALALLVVLLPAAGRVAADPQALARAHWIGCASCHGDAGQGIRARHAPRIAGLDALYVERQLQAFRSGARGTHALDVRGRHMNLVASGIADDAVLEALGAHVATLPAQPVARTLGEGDAARGALAYSACAACHGKKGEGNASPGAPAIAGMDDWYLLAQLRNFRAGLRGSGTDDTQGQQMAAAAATLGGERELHDVVAYVAGLAVPR